MESKADRVAGAEFEDVERFHNTILQTLRGKWVLLSENEKADYYQGLLRFQEEYGYPLRVFSLNYDLCVETICGQDHVHRGFAGRSWDWRSFDETSEDAKPLILYKLHGSVDWHFTGEGNVTYSDSSPTIDNDKLALIFGTSYKLQYVDPFLFLAYELRRWTLDAARIIICIGYGFNDEHINGILQQSLRQDLGRKLFSVTMLGDESSVDRAKKHVCRQLEAADNQVIVYPHGAKRFFVDDLSIAYLSRYFPAETDLFPQVAQP